MTLASENSLADLRGTVAGEVLLPGDTGYDQARSVWNGQIDRKPAVIARCTSAGDVARAIAFGREQQLEISVRGGGHNFAGLAVVDAGLMIDLSLMNGVSVDPGARRARAGGGATWADLDAATQAHGLAVTGGVISHTGVGGLTLGGGFGWLTRKLGLSCDNVVGAEVVTVDGRILDVSAGEHADLFWAIRGGGGNFGVVTSIEFELAEVGPMANLAMLFWGMENAAEALRSCRELIRSLPDDVGCLIGGLHAPPEPFVPTEYQLRPGFALLLASWGSPEEHERLVQPARDAVAPLFEMVTPIPYTELQKMFDAGNPWGILGYEKALYLDDLTDGVIDVFTEFLPKKASPMSFVPVFPLGAAYGAVADDATAFGGSRSAGYLVNIGAICPTPELFEMDRAWVRQFWDALQPHATGVGSYVNFLVEPDDVRIRVSYGDKYARLAAIKAEYDPDNVLHLNANIKPAS